MPFFDLACDSGAYDPFWVLIVAWGCLAHDVVEDMVKIWAIRIVKLIEIDANDSDFIASMAELSDCLLYTSDAADE